MAARPTAHVPLPTRPPARPPYDWRALAWIAAIFVLYWLWMGAHVDATPQPLTYTAFKEDVRAGDVETVTLRGDQLTGTLRAPLSPAAAFKDKPPTPTAPRFSTTVPKRWGIRSYSICSTVTA